MNRKTNNRAMCGLQFSLHCLRLFLLVTCYFILLYHKEILGCPSMCQLCTGKQINCRNLGLSSIPKNFPESAVFLYLTGNNISHITESEFTGLYSLVALYLDNSSIVYVYPKAFVELKHLYFLYLNDNFIKRLDPGMFEGLSNLRNLYLQSNQVSFIPRGVFHDLVLVQYLNLQRNHLTILGSGTFVGMIALRTLDLSNNKILRISNSGFQHLGNLDCLYLESNNLTKVPSNAFGVLKSLKRLSLSHNHIEAIQPFAFKGLVNLEYLLLKNAKIKNVTRDGLSGINNLKYLILSHNDIENLNSDTFSVLTNLIYLQLDRNRIINIDDDTFENMGASLKILNLSFNNLTDLHPKVLKPLSSLIHLQANSNPWECNCQLLGLRDWLVSSAITLNIYCQNPPSLRGRALHYIKWTDFTNCATSSSNVSRTWAEKSLHIHHKTTALMMAWHKVTTNGKHLENAETGSITFGEQIHTSPASRFFQENTFGNPLETTAVLPMQIQLTSSINVNFEENSPLPSDAAPVSGKTSLICAQEVEKLNEAFDILLAFFILACVLIIFLIYKIVQFKQKLKASENSGENRLEYYSFYQSARYNIAGSICNTSPNSLESPGLEQSQLHKQIVPESEVIIFEHSAL
ncbi:PREDICTED: leucine-rich repeat-containing protein 70 [Chrysochloris asiatica]|uniref:Leucine-rich repeat-containing protein 70 n=1 Tax=Chrysochloris asiatica TaxID=185453 RepID=A0A9B0UBM0_CHRAS|nr:PREDICTED: leucine-rich repeat-containing protein 70 [Chrysochloris asiatica]